MFSVAYLRTSEQTIITDRWFSWLACYPKAIPDLNSVTHWTKNELQPLVAPPSRIRLAAWTGSTELQIR